MYQAFSGLAEFGYKVEIFVVALIQHPFQRVRFWHLIHSFGTSRKTPRISKLRSGCGPKFKFQHNKKSNTKTI